MAVFDQMKTTYSDTTPHERVISEAISIIDPRDTPLIAALGGLDGARSKFGIRMNGYKIEILEDELDPLSNTLAASCAADATSLHVTDASVYQDGDIIMIDSEYMIVTASNVSTNYLTVQDRTYGGTNATHASAAVVYIVGMARAEGDAADYGPITDITAPYNYTSTYQKALNISRTQQLLAQHGISDEKTYQSMKQIPSLLRKVELACFHSQRAAGDGTNTRRSMGGLGTFVTDNYVNAGGSIAKAHVDTAMRYAFLDGGYPDLFVCNPITAGGLRDLIDTSSFVNLNYQNNQIGMQPIQRVVTQYGELQIVMSRFCPSTKAYLLNSKKVGLYTFSPFAWHDLAKLGDSDSFEVVGEFSLMVANDKAHAYIYGITNV
jgi:hypothetical protein